MSLKDTTMEKTNSLLVVVVIELAIIAFLLGVLIGAQS